MNEVGTLVLLGLAAHRLWVLWLTQEIFRPLRERLGRIHPKVQYLVNCASCTSIWIAAGIGLTWVVLPEVIWVLAVSDMLGLVDKALR